MMNVLARIVTVLLYPLALIARAWNALTGCDPLRLKRDDSAATFWPTPPDDICRTGPYGRQGAQ